jgi:hypothetical protein
MFIAMGNKGDDESNRWGRLIAASSNSKKGCLNALKKGKSNEFADGAWTKIVAPGGLLL